MKIKFLSLLLTLLIIAGALPLSVDAKVPETDNMSIVESDLLYGYLLKLGTEKAEGTIMPRSTSNLETKLNTKRNQTVYKTLKKGITQIAAYGGSTSIHLSAEDISGISVTVHKNSDIRQALIDEISSKIDFYRINQCLLGDCPYELYWYDKTQGYMWYYSWNYVTNGNYVTATITDIQVDFYVSQSYRTSNYTTQNPAVTTAVSNLGYVASRAKAVVSANSNKNDRGKLEAYRDYICSQVSYNYDAWSNGQATQAYGDPWQLVYVFDNNSNTNVVCEGYSKAFQFLCELSTFNGDIVCYSVMGDTQFGSGAPGAHMWNIISSSEGNFLVDVTNSEQGYMGEDGSLFLNARPSQQNAYGFTITAVNNNPVTYTYYDNTIALYGADILTMGLRVAAPKVYASGTTFKESITVTMGCDTPGSYVYYNLDGGESYWYTGPLVLTESTVLRARAWKDGYLDSDVVTIEFTKIEDRRLGDVNGNGEIDTKDYMMVKRHCLKTYTLDASQLMAADVDKTGDITAKDYLMIKRHCLRTFTIRG